jgi:hypothetical protein
LGPHKTQQVVLRLTLELVHDHSVDLETVRSILDFFNELELEKGELMISNLSIKEEQRATAIT